MTTPSANEPLKAGTRVKLLDSGFKTGRIVEYRGALAPGGIRVYGIQRGPQAITLHGSARNNAGSATSPRRKGNTIVCQGPPWACLLWR